MSWRRRRNGAWRAVGLPPRRPFIALGPDKLGRLLVEQRVERLLVDRCDVRRRDRSHGVAAVKLILWIIAAAIHVV